jgi:hypothetical protein
MPGRPCRGRGAVRRGPGSRSPAPVCAALARVVTFKFSFKFSLIHVLRRALRRAMIRFKFRLISALCRTMIHFNSSLCSVLRRAFRCVTFRFKFSLIIMCCRALRRTTIYFKFSLVQV